MATLKRLRGRPVGSGKDDVPTLMKVARILAENPTLKPTTAMNRVINAGKNWPETDATLRRRLQAKWRGSGQTLLERARQELVPKASTLPEILARMHLGFCSFMASPRVVQALGNLDSTMSKLANSPEVAKALETLNAWDRKWKEMAASSPWFDMNKLAALEQSMRRFAPSLSLEMQNQLPHLDDATRRYLTTGLLSVPLSEGPTNTQVLANHYGRGSGARFSSGRPAAAQPSEPSGYQSTWE